MTTGEQCEISTPHCDHHSSLSNHHSSLSALCVLRDLCGESLSDLARPIQKIANKRQKFLAGVFEHEVMGVVERVNLRVGEAILPFR